MARAGGGAFLPPPRPLGPGTGPITRVAANIPNYLSDVIQELPAEWSLWAKRSRWGMETPSSRPHDVFHFSEPGTPGPYLVLLPPSILISLHSDRYLVLVHLEGPSEFPSRDLPDLFNLPTPPRWVMVAFAPSPTPLRASHWSHSNPLRINISHTLSPVPLSPLFPPSKRVISVGSSSAETSPAETSSSSSSSLPATFPYPPQAYTWRDFSINYHVTGPEDAPPVLLVHGFGASARHWRNQVPVLAAAGHRVYAIDLLGFGLSQKPGDLGYQFTSETWRDLLLDFTDDVLGAQTDPSFPGVALVGNSIGSLACLLAAAEAPQRQIRIRGIGVINTAGAMNNKGVGDDWRLALARPIFALIDWVLNQPTLARRIFDNVRQPETIRDVLAGVYVNQQAIDDDLVELISTPAEDPGALETFVSIITGPPGPNPLDEVREGRLDGVPLLLLWGDQDPFTPMDGPVGTFFKALPETREDCEFVVIPECGHCPHDDNPEEVHKHLLPWLEQIR